MLRFSIIWLFFISSLWLTAQNPHPYFRNYTTDDGLPSPEVHYCIQDTLGYMWFATDNGLSRFDGYEFKNYGPQQGLKHNVVFYMQKDPQGKIWLATMHGHLYFIEKDSIQPFAQNDIIESKNSKPFFTIDFYIDSEGKKYLSIIGVGIFQFLPDGTYQLITPSRPETERLYLKLKDQWISTSQHVPDSLRKSYWNKDFNTHDISSAEIFGDSIYYLDRIQITQKISSSDTWIKSLNDGQVLGFSNTVLYEVQKEKIDWKYYTSFDVQKKAFYQDEEKGFLLGLLSGKGLRRYRNVKAIRNNKYEQYLKGSSISHIYKDKDDGYWMSSLENGVFYCPNFDLSIYNQSAGLPSNHVTAFDFKNDKQIFVGFHNGRMGFLNTTNHEFKLSPSILTSSLIYDIFFDSNRQEFWVSFDNKMPHYYSNKRWNSVAVRGKLDFRTTKRFSNSRDSNFLWGGGISGITKIDLDKKEMTPQSKGTDQKRAYRIWQDQKNKMWVGNVNGLFEFKKNRLIRPEPFHQAFEIRIEDIGELSDGRLVLATKGGGVLIWSENYFRQLTTKDGMTSDMLENIYVDKKDQIWAGTLAGLNKIALKEDDFLIKKYTTFHGLPSNEINRVKSHNGQIWVATPKGLIEWKEKKQSTYSTTPIIETILVNNQLIDFSETATFPYDKNDIVINFISINYTQNGKIRYRFRLNNGEWNYINNRSVNFADLSPADYTFEVQSQNEDEIWSNSNIVKFEIRPAFWQTTWFTILWVSSLLLIGWLFYQNRIKALQKTAAMQKEIADVEKEMHQLQLSALRAQMNPHFIFNCLNSIQNFIVQNDKKNATIYLSKFAHLIRGALDASQDELITLENEIGLLENYLSLEKLRHKEKFDYSINVDDKLMTAEIMLPPLLAQPFLENAIIHGFSNKQEKGILELSFLKEMNNLLISIKDNGNGIYQTQSKKQESTIQHKGVGMSISEKRLQLIKGVIDFKIEELKDEAAKITGTLIEMKIPLS